MGGRSGEKRRMIARPHAWRLGHDVFWPKRCADLMVRQARHEVQEVGLTLISSKGEAGPRLFPSKRTLL
jgi:hypothetical protein